MAQQDPPQAEKPAAPAPSPTAKAQNSESVASRIGRLEGQFVDLQVMVGTLESLLRAKPGAVLPQETASPPAPAPVPATQGDLAPRIDALETQIGALTHQIERIGQQMSALEARLAGSPPEPPTPLPQEEVPSFRQGLAPMAPAETASAITEDDTSKPRWFGPRPGEQDASDPVANEPPQESTGQPQSIMAALPGMDAPSLYQEGYGQFLKGDYPGAEAAFRQFVATYPADPLAGNAQYWLGESYYARGQYKSAADAFLKGYQTYKSGDKGPDSLLKLGMSLAALGQKEAACSSFGELGAKFPSAPESVRDQARAERKKAGC